METIVKMFRAFKAVLNGYTLEDIKFLYLEEGILNNKSLLESQNKNPRVEITINDFVENGSKLFISTYGLMGVLNKMYVNNSNSGMILPY